MTWWWFAAACTRLPFIEPPAQCEGRPPLADEGACLVIPSFAGCIVELGTYVERGLPGERWVFGEEGRLAEMVYRPDDPFGTTTAYEWSGACLTGLRTAVGTPLDGPVPAAPPGGAIVEYTCDGRDRPLEELTSVVWGDGSIYASSHRSFVNRYDPLGQPVALEVYDDLDTLVDWRELLWDGQGRVARLTYPDLDGSGENMRDYRWDQDRLLGWTEKTDHRDPSMVRTFDRNRLLTEQQFVEEALVQTITWTYPDDRGGPLAVAAVENTGASWTREVAVRCGD